MTDSNDRPAVTVVIPCFNQARFLAGAVASVRGQRPDAVECIVVNDGSTDDTAVVASSLGIRVLEQSNRGLSEARNAGLAAARSEFVVFLDADDELLPYSVSACAGALASDSSAAAIVGRCQVINASGDAVPAFHGPVDRSNLYEEWLSRNFVWTPGAAMFRKRALDEMGGFPAGLGPAADYAVYLRLARTGGIRFIEKDLVRYRQHERSMSRDPVIMLRATLAVLGREQSEAPPSLRRHVSRGRKSWCDWYGEQIVQRLRTDWHAGRRGGPQIRAAVTLVRHSPAVVVRHIRRKAWRVFNVLWHRAATAFVHLQSAWRRKVAR
jgi:glycosyltransferase involved in cell wall biosynthesis